MRRFVLVLVTLTVLTAAAVAQEKSTLATPATATVTDYQVARIDIERLPTWQLTIVYVDNLGTRFVDVHQGVVDAVTNPTGADVLVKALNTANLTTKSLERRALEHLVSEGKIPAATMTGTPQ